MLWSEKNAEAAKQEGWALIDTIDVGSSQVYLRVYSLIDQRHAAATASLVANARRGSRLHVEALRAISQSRVAQKGKRK